MIIALQYDILLVGNRQGVFLFLLSVSSLSPHVVRMFIGTYVGVASDLLGKCHGLIYIKMYEERCNMKSY